MLRVVVAVVLALALLGAVLPVLDTLRVDTGHATVRAVVDRVGDAAVTLRARNDARPGPGGARRLLSLSLPRRSWGSRGLAWLAVRPTNASATRVSWRIRGGGTRHRTLPAGVVPAGDGFRLGGARDLAVRLVLTREAGRRIVRIERVSR